MENDDQKHIEAIVETAVQARVDSFKKWLAIVGVSSVLGLVAIAYGAAKRTSETVATRVAETEATRVIGSRQHEIEQRMKDVDDRLSNVSDDIDSYVRDSGKLSGKLDGETTRIESLQLQVTEAQTKVDATKDAADKLLTSDYGRFALALRAYEDAGNVGNALSQVAMAQDSLQTVKTFLDTQLSALGVRIATLDADLGAVRSGQQTIRFRQELGDTKLCMSGKESDAFAECSSDERVIAGGCKNIEGETQLVTSSPHDERRWKCTVRNGGAPIAKVAAVAFCAHIEQK